MKSIAKKLVLSLFTFIMVVPIFTMAASAKTETYKNCFPDKAFRSVIMKLVGESNEKAKINKQKLAEIRELNISNFYGNANAIGSLDQNNGTKGIEYLTGLKKLDCSHQGLNNIDVSKNKELE